MKTSFLIISFITISIISKSQGSIGWTEQQIRSEYSNQKETEISTDYVNNEKNIIVVNREATASFNINPTTNLCNKSMLKFNTKELLTKYVEEFNSRYEIIIKGNSWKTTLRGHLIKIELRYLTKMQSTVIVFYEEN